MRRRYGGVVFFVQPEDGIRDIGVTGVQTCALPIFTEPPKLKKQEKRTIEVIVDRLTVKESAKRRLTDSVETALGLAGGLVVLNFVDLDESDPHRERTFSEHLACVDDGLSFEALEPRSFSFNSPFEIGRA